MNPETRYSGMWVCAQQGTGKTNLLLHMLASDLQKHASIIILDSKGDLTNQIKEISLHRMLVLDARQPFAINPLDVPKTDVKRAVNQLEYIFGALMGATVTPKQQSFLRSLLRALIIGFPNPTLETIDELIKYGWQKYATYIVALSEDLRYFFHEEWKEYDATRNELKWRMRLLMETDLVQKMFNAPRTRFNMADAMDNGTVLVVENSQQHLHEDGAAFLGRFIIAQIWAAATQRASRPQSEKRPVYVYIDEAQVMLDNKIAAIIDECRSQRIALILAHQRKSQVQDANVLGALENCAIKMVNVDAEASYFSKLLHIPEERMNRLPVGHFAYHERGQEPCIIQVPRASLPFRTITENERAFQREMTQRLYGPETHKPATEVAGVRHEADASERAPPSVPRTELLPPEQPEKW